jgi:chaperonin cofactor prefoldin
MGLAASQARFLNLTGRLSLVQRQGQFINQQRSAITNELNQCMNGTQNQVAAANPFIRGGGETPEYFGKQKSGKNKNNNNQSSYNGDNSFSSAMDSLVSAVSQYPGANKSPMQLDTAKLAQLQSQDARLELIFRTLDTQEHALQTEISAVTKVIDKNIEHSFKLMA